jgi:predicted tellurium resistance membrane protein TerC
MNELFTSEALISLVTLAALEIILGIDNVIFVSIIMGRMPEEQRKKARTFWMIFGIISRTALLFALGWLLSQKGNALFTINIAGLTKAFDLASLVMIAGGLFLIVKTVMEIHHKLEGDEEESEKRVTSKSASFGKALTQIALVDMVFSFDSVITASGIGKNLIVMITAVVIAMIVMFLFSERISNFIHKHPTLTMLALSFLVMVGLVLVIDGWREASMPRPLEELHLKNYVYFAMAFSFGVELLNMRLRKKTKPPLELREPHMRNENESNKVDL